MFVDTCKPVKSIRDFVAPDKKILEQLSFPFTVNIITGMSLGHQGITSASCCTSWGKVVTCPLYALCPPPCFVYTCITGKALAINISSNCVKSCNSSGTGEGIS